MNKTVLARISLSLLGFRFFIFLPAGVGMVLSAVYFVMQDPGVSLGKVTGLACLATLFGGNYLGFYLQPFLSRLPATLIPGFVAAHAAFVLSLNAMIALAATSVIAMGRWPNVSHVALFSILWGFGSLWTCVVYIGRGTARPHSVQEMWWLWGPVSVMTLIPAGTLYPFLSELLVSTPATTTIALLLAGLVLNGLFGIYVLKAPSTGGDGKRLYLRDWATRGPLADKRFWNRNLRALDSIGHPVAADFFSHVRLLRLSRQLPSKTLLLSLFLAGISLGQYQSTRQQANLADTTILWMAYALLIPLVPVGLCDSRGVDFKLLSRLPLRRQDLVARQGVATLLHAFDMWLIFVAAASLAALLPESIGLKAFPSSGFLVASFTTLLAVLGILALLASVPVSAGWKATASFPLFALLGLAAWLSPSPLYPVLAGVFAIGLMWASFRFLCSAEAA
jgi:hypothetical protein